VDSLRSQATGDPVQASAAEGQAPTPVKIIIAGGFGVGKTTTVGAISDIAPLTTEAEMTAAAVGVDDPGGARDKTTTTVAMDFGCVTIDQRLKLYLFGTPGQARFGFMWDDRWSTSMPGNGCRSATSCSSCSNRRWPAPSTAPARPRPAAPVRTPHRFVRRAPRPSIHDR
jgi:hypothetical protein